MIPLCNSKTSNSLVASYPIHELEVRVRTVFALYFFSSSGVVVSFAFSTLASLHDFVTRTLFIIIQLTLPFFIHANVYVAGCGAGIMVDNKSKAAVWAMSAES